MKQKDRFAKGFHGDMMDEETADTGMAPAVAVVVTPDTNGDAMPEPTEPAASAAPAEAEMPTDAGMEELPAEGAEEVPAEAELPVEPDGDEMPEMNQSEKSWNGRLSARERELKAKADELSAREQAMSERESSAPATGNISYDEAVQRLGEDFGPDFVEMIRVVASGAAGESSNNLSGIEEKIAGIEEAVGTAFTDLHKDMISSAHEDFEDIAQSDQFMEWLAGLDEGARDQMLNVVENGTPGQVVRMLNQFKDSLKASEQAGESAPAAVDTAALDAAAGVRSAGGKAPGMNAGVGGSEVDRFKAGFYS